MSKTEKLNNTDANRVSHEFPSFKGDTAPKIKKDTSGCMLFKPMFTKGCLNRSSSQSRSTSDRENNPEVLLKRASQCGYERGFAAGQSDACEIAKKDLSPTIKDLRESLDQFNTYQQDLAERYSSYSLSLALAIVKKITDFVPDIDQENLTEVKAIIQSAIQQAYGMTVNFNPADFQSLESLSVCDELVEWEQYPKIDLHSDQAVSSGTLKSSAPNPEWTSIHQQVASQLITSLKASTK